MTPVPRRLLLVCVACFAAAFFPDAVATQAPVAGEPAPRVLITSAPSIVLPGGVDSNSPAIWSNEDGVSQLAVMTSTAGAPRVAVGSALNRLGVAQDVVFNPHPGHGVWMEAVVVDDEGTW